MAHKKKQAQKHRKKAKKHSGEKQFRVGKKHSLVSVAHSFSEGKPSDLHPGNIPRHLDKYETAFVLEQGKKPVHFFRHWRKGFLDATGFKIKIKKTEKPLSKLLGKETIEVIYHIGTKHTSAIYSLKGDLLAVKGFHEKWHLVKH